LWCETVLKFHFHHVIKPCAGIERQEPFWRRSDATFSQTLPREFFNPLMWDYFFLGWIKTLTIGGLDRFAQTFPSHTSSKKYNTTHVSPIFNKKTSSKSKVALPQHAGIWEKKKGFVAKDAVFRPRHTRPANRTNVATWPFQVLPNAAAHVMKNVFNLVFFLVLCFL